MHRFGFIRYPDLQILQLPVFTVINIHSPFLCVWVRAKLDDNARLLDFTQKLEAACVGAVESGKMTKDLALLVHGSSKYVAAVFVLLPHSCGMHLVILY